MALPTYAFAFSANVLLGVFLLMLSGVLLRWMRDRKAGLFLAAYFALVGVNYFLDGLRSSAGLFSEGWQGLTNGRPVFAAVQATTLLDPLPLLLFSLAVARGRLSVARIVLAVLPIAAVFAVSGWPDAHGWGWPVWPFVLVVLELVVYYGLAFVILTRKYLAETRSVERDRLGLLVVALGIAVLPRLALTYIDLGFATRVSPPPGFPAPAVMLLGALALVFALCAAVMLRLSRPETRAHVEQTLRFLGRMLSLVALTWTLYLLPGSEALGYALLFSGRWFVFAGFFAVWIRHHDFLDLPDRPKAVLRHMLVLLVSGLLLAQAGALASKLWGAPWGTLAFYGVAVLALGAAVYATFRMALPRDSSQIAWQRLQVYRAQAELGATEGELQVLGERLGLSDREAREIQRVVRLERSLAPRNRREVLAPGAVLLGRYEVGALAGAGTFGRIHEATDRMTGERVVLKELNLAWQSDGEALERFRREAQTALEVTHPNLVAFRAFERVAGGHVLVLARVEGETLAHRLARRPLSSAETTRVAQDVLAGLAALHGLGIVHRDVKPENIMLRPDGRAVLLDFGCVTTARVPHGTRAESAAHPGTPEYMSPEQARGEHVTPASDVYALGVVLRECLAVEPPRETVPLEWRRVLARALDTDPRRRWESAQAFREGMSRAARRSTHP